MGYLTHVVNAKSVLEFEKKLDIVWANQEKKIRITIKLVSSTTNQQQYRVMSRWKNRPDGLNPEDICKFCNNDTWQPSKQGRMP